MRRLSEADRAAWNAYRKTADPLGRGMRDVRPDPDSDPARPAPAPRPAPATVPRFRIAQAAGGTRSTHDVMAPLAQRLAAQPVTMDAKAFHRLKAGKLRPEAKLDLHGMTLEVAHPELIDFVQSCRARGKRLLLVVTGKGKRRADDGPIPTRFGVLKHQVPQWLRMPPLSPMILQVAQAHRSHGGEGAYYVYLRR
ncbi:Smr/MutS family protein [Jannaschia sp. LMIT008]|uniref:Smr/MutS family protein n=1 Tax=Jannaschia maritima TaxID=3032585 RepID=UPI00281175F0|nr:Smr/MutS family protein [Jannaschia sp. LMIT008]